MKCPTHGFSIPCPKCNDKQAHRQAQREVTNSCPICNAAPRWKDRPDAPGLWITRTDLGSYDTYDLERFGPVFLLEWEQLNEGEPTTPNSWFGPIPYPDAISPAEEEQ